MFDKLTDTFNGLFKKLSGNDTITEANVRDAMGEVRTALLEADVHLDVVNQFSESVLKDALGRDVTKSLKPGQEMIGIVYDRLVELLGGRKTNAASMPDVPAPLAAASAGGDQVPHIMKAVPGPTIIMMCGLQGSGKTTTCGKLAAYLKKRGRSVMLAALDLQRPAAVEQLETVTGQVRTEMQGGANVEFYAEKDKVQEYGKAVGVAVQVAQRALDAARKAGVDVLILDTAGRLHINDELMGELEGVKRVAPPHHIFLVVDAMTGQDAVNSARAFHKRLAVDGVIMTKFDSDTRGGAALSVKHVTGAPIKFVGVGEKLDALEEFHAERFAGRILGMGDVVALVEKAQEQVDEEDAKNLQEKMARGEMSMDDFLKQLKTLRKMGPIKQLLGLLPGVGSLLKGVNIEDKQLDRVEAQICSMTKEERKKPSSIDFSRRKRIAAGSGAKQEEVGALVKQFDMVSKMTKQMAALTTNERVKAVKDLGDPAAAMAAMRNMPGLMGGRGSTHTASIKDRFKKRKK
jgi:signal recognition particle subunit SRP54